MRRAKLEMLPVRSGFERFIGATCMVASGLFFWAVVFLWLSAPN